LAAAIGKSTGYGVVISHYSKLVGAKAAFERPVGIGIFFVLLATIR
jgi:hypothetical protein